MFRYCQFHSKISEQVEIKRTIPKGAAESKDFKTKKIFVGGIPTSVTEGLASNFFYFLIFGLGPIIFILVVLLLSPVIVVVEPWFP